MAKSIEAKLYRYCAGKACSLRVGPNGDLAEYDFCWKDFRKIFPVFCKGLQASKTRKLKLTYLKKGIKLERVK